MNGHTAKSLCLCAYAKSRFSHDASRIRSYIFRCEKQTQKIHIYDGRGNSRPLYLLDKLHYKPVIEIKVKNAHTGGEEGPLYLLEKLHYKPVIEIKGKECTYWGRGGASISWTNYTSNLS